MLIRTLIESDIPCLQKLYRYLAADNAEIPLPEAITRWELLKSYPNSNIFVVCLENILVASCTLVVIPNLTRNGMPYALIENVVTHEDHRKQGYGSAVLHRAIEAAWQAGCYKVMLMTGSKQSSTLKFYQDAGFEQSKTGFQIRRPKTA